MKAHKFFALVHKVKKDKNMEQRCLLTFQTMYLVLCDQIIYYIELSAARLQPSIGKQEMKYKTIYL